MWKIFFTPIQTDHDDDERLSPTFTVGSQRHRVEWEPDYVEELSIAAPFVFVTRRGRRRWRQVSSNDSDASPAQYFVVLILIHIHNTHRVFVHTVICNSPFADVEGRMESKMLMRLCTVHCRSSKTNSPTFPITPQCPNPNPRQQQERSKSAPILCRAPPLPKKKNPAPEQ